MNKLHFLLLLTTLTGCVVPSAMNFPIKPTNIELETASYGERPNQHKKIIENYIKSTLIDPDSAKFTNYSTPKKDWLSDNNIGGKTYLGWLVCVDVNAKNRYGGYVGRKFYTFIFRGSKIVYSQNEATNKTVADGWKKPNDYRINCKY